eukprot:m.1430234 g.1430234  ORF g.1430234 m.1430234 type:complete len:905 (-) comp25072_c0_seq8:2740-5454(-)
MSLCQIMYFPRHQSDTKCMLQRIIISVTVAISVHGQASIQPTVPTTVQTTDVSGCRAFDAVSCPAGVCIAVPTATRCEFRPQTTVASTSGEATSVPLSTTSQMLSCSLVFLESECRSAEHCQWSDFGFCEDFQSTTSGGMPTGGTTTAVSCFTFFNISECEVHAHCAWDFESFFCSDLPDGDDDEAGDDDGDDGASCFSLFTESECSAISGCSWNTDFGGFCEVGASTGGTTPPSSACAVIFNQTLCDATFPCRWDPALFFCASPSVSSSSTAAGEVTSGPDCFIHFTEGNCTAATGCIWNPLFGGFCEVPPTGCAAYTSPAACNTAVESCAWDSAFSFCSDDAGFDCLSVLNESSCVTFAGCVWDSTFSFCNTAASTTPFPGSTTRGTVECFTMFDQTQCVTAGCEWDAESFFCFAGFSTTGSGSGSLSTSAVPTDCRDVEDRTFCDSLEECAWSDVTLSCQRNRTTTGTHCPSLPPGMCSTDPECVSRTSPASCEPVPTTTTATVTSLSTTAERSSTSVTTATETSSTVTATSVTTVTTTTSSTVSITTATSSTVSSTSTVSSVTSTSTTTFITTSMTTTPFQEDVVTIAPQTMNPGTRSTAAGSAYVIVSFDNFAQQLSPADEDGFASNLVLRIAAVLQVPVASLQVTTVQRLLGTVEVAAAESIVDRIADLSPSDIAFYYGDSQWQPSSLASSLGSPATTAGSRGMGESTVDLTATTVASGGGASSVNTDSSGTDTTAIVVAVVITLLVVGIIAAVIVRHNSNAEKRLTQMGTYEGSAPHGQQNFMQNPMFGGTRGSANNALSQLQGTPQNSSMTSMGTGPNIGGTLAFDDSFSPSSSQGRTSMQTVPLTPPPMTDENYQQTMSSTRDALEALVLQRQTEYEGFGQDFSTDDCDGFSGFA